MKRVKRKRGKKKVVEKLSSPGPPTPTERQWRVPMAGPADKAAKTADGEGQVLGRRRHRKTRAGMKAERGRPRKVAAWVLF